VTTGNQAEWLEGVNGQAGSEKKQWHCWSKKEYLHIMGGKP
jgi:hypothetical protein